MSEAIGFIPAPGDKGKPSTVIRHELDSRRFERTFFQESFLDVLA
jgi:hypothetical protein